METINLIRKIVFYVGIPYLSIFFIIFKRFSAKKIVPLMFIVGFIIERVYDGYKISDRLAAVLVYFALASIPVGVLKSMLHVFYHNKKLKSMRVNLMRNPSDEKVDEFINFFEKNQINYNKLSSSNYELAQQIKQMYTHIKDSDELTFEYIKELYNVLSIAGFFVTKPFNSQNQNQNVHYTTAKSFYEFNEESTREKVLKNYKETIMYIERDEKLTACTRLRTSLEHITKFILGVNYIEFESSNTIHVNLGIIKQSQLISKQFLDNMYFIKDVGNKGVHQETDDHIEFAVNNVALATKYMDRIIKQVFEEDMTAYRVVFT